MGYFPFFMDLEGKCGVIVGGGNVAARKSGEAARLRPGSDGDCAGYRSVCENTGKLLQEGAAASLQFEERAFRLEDLDHTDFVIAATDDTVLNGEIADCCKARRICGQRGG